MEEAVAIFSVVAAIIILLVMVVVLTWERNKLEESIRELREMLSIERAARMRVEWKSKWK